MKPWMIALIVVLAVLVLLSIVLLVVFLNKKKKVRQSEEKVEEKIQTSASHLSALFGGKENILGISSKGSRVSVTLKNISLVDKEAVMKELESCVFMGNRIVFIIGSKSADFEKLLSENIEKQSE